ncbi:MAG TPA: hypothetical protein VGZ47_13730 [Gemmataceae bacterium]|jgi:hypothetical protein|nr:hypothetical protein [Gemmataceae bacterium]
MAAAEKVKERMRRACSALSRAGVAYAVIGGNAVAEWVGRVDEAAVRNTRDVDILFRRADLDAAKNALETVGFVHANVLDVDLFLDGPSGRPKDAVHVVFANEKVRPDDVAPTPDVDESEPSPQFQVASLPALVFMKLTSFRLKDKLHLLDMIDVGLVDRAWLSRLPPELSRRLQELLDNPDG